MRTEVYKCRFTGKIFEKSKKEKYIAHLAKIRANMRLDRLAAIHKKEWKAWLKEERSKIYSLDEIGPWFIKNQKHILECAHSVLFSDKSFRCNSSKEVTISGKYFVDLKLENTGKILRDISNSHNCPDGGVTNCERDTSKPMFYKGFASHLKIEFVPNREGLYSYTDVLKFVGIHTGGGSGSTMTAGYRLSIFLDDWPGLGHSVAIEKLIGKE